MRRPLIIFLIMALACLPASAQFVPGQVLNAAALNAALASPAITSGSINGTPIGGTIPAAGTFTILNATTGVFSTATANTVASLAFQAALNEVLLKSTPTGALHIGTSQPTAPTCTSGCGATPTIVGTDSVMTLTMGATGTPTSGFVITFNQAWSAMPACLAQMAKAGMVIGKLPMVASPTLSTLTITTNGTAPSNSDIYVFQCERGGV